MGIPFVSNISPALVSSVTRDPLPFMVGDQRPKRFEFNTSTLLEKALKALPRHFRLKQTFVFLFFIFLGADIASAVLKSRWIRRCKCYHFLGKQKKKSMHHRNYQKQFYQ